MLKIFIAGATGWAGSALSKAIYNHPQMQLVGGLSRNYKNKNLAEVLNLGKGEIPIFSDIKTAIDKVEFNILVEYTKPGIAKNNIIEALKNNKNVVVGTSGLTDQDYTDIEIIANSNFRSVLAVGNFSITAVLLQKFSEIAAKYIPNFEIIEYTHEDKADVPSGTVRELVNKISSIRSPNLHISDEQISGLKEARGGSLNGVKVHAVRLPSYTISAESIFSLSDERLTIRHDSGTSAEPYVKGALMAIEKVGTFKGLKRGLDSVMDI